MDMKNEEGIPQKEGEEGMLYQWKLFQNRDMRAGGVTQVGVSA
jgi:hypothetical protein